MGERAKSVLGFLPQLPDERVYFIRAVAYDSKGDKQAALADYKKAAQLYEAKGDRPNYQQVSKRIRELSGN